MNSDFEKSLISSVKEMVKYYSEQNSRSVEPGVEIARAIDVVDLVSDIKVDSREHFVAISLDNRNRVLRKSDVSIGLINQSLVHPREVFRNAIIDNAVSMIFVHNHPNGTLFPSDEDIKTTKRLIKCGKLLGIKVLDHLIVTRDSYASILSSPEWLVSKNR